MRNKSPSILQLIFIIIIGIITFWGFLWNCTFSMDTTKYPNRLTCGVNQYVGAIQYVIWKIFNHRMEKAENKIENLQNTMSGTLNNFQSGGKN